MTTSEKTEWISAAELMVRVDSSKIVIGGLRKAGKLTHKKDGKLKNGKILYKWPVVKNEFEEAQSEKRQVIAQNQGRIKFEINSPEYKDLTVGERVLKAIELGAKNAPDLAYQYAKSVNEMVKSRMATLKLLEAEGKTLTKAEVEHMAFSQGRQHRDHWLNWPERIAVKMGEELGVDTKLCHDVLKKYVRLQLERSATEPVAVPPDLSDDVPEGGDASSGSIS